MRVVVVTSLLSLALCGCIEDVPSRAVWKDGYSPVTGVAPLGYVSNNGSDSVSVVALGDLTEIARVPVGRDPVTPEALHHLALDPESGFLYVGLSNTGVLEGGGVHGSHGGGSLASFVARLDSSDFTPMGDLRVGTNLGDVIFSAGNRKVISSHFDYARARDALAGGMPREAGYASLYWIDTDTFERAFDARICTAPHGIAASANGSTVVAACYGDDGVAFVDVTATGATVTARVPIGPSPGDISGLRYGPYSVLLSPDGSTAFVGLLDGDAVTAIDVASRTVIKDGYISMPGAAYFSATDEAGSVLWVPTQARDGLMRVDWATRAIVASRFFSKDECVSPHQAKFVSSIGRVIVVCEGDHVSAGRLVALDPVSLDVLDSVEVGVYPDGLEVRL